MDNESGEVTENSVADVTVIERKKRKRPLEATTSLNATVSGCSFLFRTVEYKEPGKPAKRRAVCDGDLSFDIPEPMMSTILEDRSVDYPLTKRDEVNHGRARRVSLMRTDRALAVKADIVIVVDTNIFVHRLMALATLLRNLEDYNRPQGRLKPPPRSQPIAGNNIKVSVRVPQVVLTELDHLKRKTSAVEREARTAISFIERELSRKTTVFEVESPEVAETVYDSAQNDNKIFDFCLRLSVRQSVALWTDDKNLRNKAMAANVRLCNTQIGRGRNGIDDLVFECKSARMRELPSPVVRAGSRPSFNPPSTSTPSAHFFSRR